MTIMLRGRNRRSSAHGFTLVELLVYIVLALLVVGAVFRVFVSQSRQHGLHVETMDARQTLRGAAALLTTEMRGLSASRGDLYAIAPQSISLRSVQALGVICDAANEPRYGLWHASGTFEATADDSALVNSASTGTWSRVKVAAVWEPSGGGVSTCAWPGAAPTDAVVETGGADLTAEWTAYCNTLPPGPKAFCLGAADWPSYCAGLAGPPKAACDAALAAAQAVGVTFEVGSPFRAFRRVEYGMLQQDGRWWLGRKVGAAASYELVTGPLRAPADSGLALHYYDAAGVETADPTQVTRVEVVLRSESFGKARSTQGVTTRLDSVTVVSFLRN